MYQAALCFAVYDKVQDDAVVGYQEVSNRNRTTSNVKDIMSAAFNGRVDVLFLNADEQHWGRFYEKTGHCELHHQKMPDDGDSLELAAVWTVANGETVYVMGPDGMPGKGSVSDLFRY
jgi:hypothetical protein